MKERCDNYNGQSETPFGFWQTVTKEKLPQTDVITSDMPEVDKVTKAIMDRCTEKTVAATFIQQLCMQPINVNAVINECVAIMEDTKNEDK